MKRFFPAFRIKILKWQLHVIIPHLPRNASQRQVMLIGFIAKAINKWLNYSCWWAENPYKPAYARRSGRAGRVNQLFIDFWVEVRTEIKLIIIAYCGELKVSAVKHLISDQSLLCNHWTSFFVSRAWSMDKGRQVGNCTCTCQTWNSHILSRGAADVVQNHILKVKQQLLSVTFHRIDSSSDDYITRVVSAQIQATICSHRVSRSSFQGAPMRRTERACGRGCDNCMLLYQQEWRVLPKLESQNCSASSARPADSRRYIEISALHSTTLVHGTFIEVKWVWMQSRNQRGELGFHRKMMGKTVCHSQWNVVEKRDVTYTHLSPEAAPAFAPRTCLCWLTVYEDSQIRNRRTLFLVAVHVHLSGASASCLNRSFRVVMASCRSAPSRLSLGVELLAFRLSSAPIICNFHGGDLLRKLPRDYIEQDDDRTKFGQWLAQYSSAADRKSA